MELIDKLACESALSSSLIIEPQPISVRHQPIRRPEDESQRERRDRNRRNNNIIIVIIIFIELHLRTAKENGN